MGDGKDVDETVKKKMKDGWIKCTMFIEVLALTEKDAREALEQHLEKMKKEDKTIIYRFDFKEIKRIEKPLKGVEYGYSKIVEIHLVTENFDKLVYLSMHYGPTNIEVLEPQRISIPIGEAQAIVNSVADLVHMFARMYKGGLPIKEKPAKI